MNWKKPIGLVSLLFILLMIYIIGNKWFEYHELKSEEFARFRLNISSLLLSYHFNFLRPPETIESIRTYIYSDSSLSLCDEEKNILAYLSNSHNYRLFTDLETGYVYFYHIGFDKTDNKLTKEIIDIDSMNFIQFICKRDYDLVLAYYELMDYCIDDDYRVYTNDDIYVNDFKNYDSIINLNIRKEARKYFHDLIDTGLFQAVFVYDFIGDTIEIQYCKSNLNTKDDDRLTFFIRNRIKKQNWGEGLDSLFIPIYIRTN